MINIARIVNRQTLGAQSFTVQRFQNAGEFELGGYQETPTVLTLYGTIQPATAKQLDMVTEGDRVRGAIAIWCSQRIYITTQAGTSDLITWKGQIFRVASAKEWSDGGFWECIAVRISGL